MNANQKDIQMRPRIQTVGNSGYGRTRTLDQDSLSDPAVSDKEPPDLHLDVKQLFEECKALRDKLTKAEEEVNMLRIYWKPRNSSRTKGVTSSKRRHVTAALCERRSNQY